jgi:hypothetical protein
MLSILHKIKKWVIVEYHPSLESGFIDELNLALLL